MVFCPFVRRVLKTLLRRLGLLPLAYAASPLLTVANYTAFQRFRRLTATLPLAPLRARFPRFLYKYLSPYAAASFSRATRLSVLTQHYQHLAACSNAAFFPALADQPVLWKHCQMADEYAIYISYALYVDYEGEISLHLSRNGIPLQVVSFVVAPGAAVGAPSPQVLLLTHVQGLVGLDELRDATKALQDVTPAALLVHAAFGLALAWGIDCAVGVGTAEKAGDWADRHFDYNGFWQLSFKAERLPQANLFLLAIPPKEKPLELIQRNHRARTLRKRQLKQQVREQVTSYWHLNFGCQ